MIYKQEVQAVQWTGDNSIEMMRFCDTGGFLRNNIFRAYQPYNKREYVELKPNDWLVFIYGTYQVWRWDFKEMRVKQIG